MTPDLRRLRARSLALLTVCLIAACEGKQGVLTDFTGTTGTTDATGTASTSGATEVVTGTVGMSSSPEPGSDASTSPPELTGGGTSGGLQTTLDSTTTGEGLEDSGQLSTTDPSATEGDTDPPFDTFDPRSDVGDGTLDEEELLLIAETPEGRVHLWWTPERLGDSWQGGIGPAALVDGSWQLVGEKVTIDNNILPVIDNYIALGPATVELPAGTHPFGPGPVAVSIFIDAWLYADKLVCGQIDIKVPGEPQLVDLVFVTKRVADFPMDPAPPLTCE